MKVAPLACITTVFLLISSCHLQRSDSALDSVQSIHHSGKILLWWTGDSETFHVKACTEPVPAETKIETLDTFKTVCKGDSAPAQATRAALVQMLVGIASEDAGFDGILRDTARRETLEQIQSDISDGEWSVEEVQTELDNLRGQLTDLAAQLEQVRKSIAVMRATAEAAAAADGRVATEEDLELIFGRTYEDAKKAAATLEQSDAATRAGIEEQLKAYATVQTSIAAARQRLQDLATAILAAIADKERVVTVSLLQRDNFEFALLQTAALRLGLIASHAPQVVTCKQACQEASPFYDSKRCYSCRCKEAMGGSLPTPAEISCKTADEIKIYKLASGAQPGTFDLAPQTQSPDECWNPSLLYGDCDVGSRLGQLQKGDVHYKWICRHRSDPTSADATYGDVGVIAINTKTGASCWWDDYGGSITDADFPKLDITDANQAEIDRYKNVWTGTTGAGCTGCHDSDPFMFSPYFHSVTWETGDYTASKYSRVQADGSLTPVETRYLASDAAAACTSCHRLGSDSTCSSWAKQSMGVTKGSGHEDLVTAALDKMEGGVRTAGANWQLAYWMPPSKPFVKGTFEKWHQKFGKAKDEILRCCAKPTAEGCAWADAEGILGAPP